MNLTKRQLNKKLKSKILLPTSTQGLMRNTKVKVMRARKDPSGYRSRTLVTIKIQALVHSTQGSWLPLNFYGPRHIRNFLRNGSNGINTEISEWVKLWGFNKEVYIESIELISERGSIS